MSAAGGGRHSISSFCWTSAGAAWVAACWTGTQRPTHFREVYADARRGSRDRQLFLALTGGPIEAVPLAAPLKLAPRCSLLPRSASTAHPPLTEVGASRGLPFGGAAGLGGLGGLAGGRAAEVCCCRAARR